MNVSRRCLDGTVQDDETLNQSQIYITTAGYKGTFSYDKLIQTLVTMVTEPDKAFIMGGTYRIPLAFGLLPKTFVSDLEKDSTFNPASFEREYESKWTGTAENAFFDGERFDRNRKIQLPEKEWSNKSSKLAYYILAVDVGRKGCQSIVAIFKVTPQATGAAIKQLVNIYDLNDDHFEDQAIKIKELYYKYKARRIVIDGNGLGIGLIDYMVKPQVLPDGDILPDFGVYGGTVEDIEQEYKKYRTPNCETDAIYVIKANAPINTEAYTAVQSAITSGRLRLLIEERTAQARLLGTKMGQKMTPEQRNEYLKPYVMTSILKEEMLNLREQTEGVNIILKPANKRISHDKFSAVAYGLYYIKQEEDSKKRKKRKFNAKDWVFMN